MKVSPDTMVAVLGAGPAGLLAAHAVALAGGEPVLFDRRAERPAPQPGVYLHRAIPDICSNEPDGQVQFVCLGSRNGYADKAYGDPTAPCSWDEYCDGQQRSAWALDPVIEDLWELYGDKVIERAVTPRDAIELVSEFGMVISTIPLLYLCKDDRHEFKTRRSWIVAGLPRSIDGVSPSDHFYVYNGFKQEPWVRCGRLFDHEWTEFGAHPELGDHERPLIARRPIDTDCDCHPDVLRAGRFGEWRRQVLLTDAFEKVWKTMFDSYEGST